MFNAFRLIIALVALLVILVFIVSSIANARFNKTIAKEVNELLSKPEGNKEIVTKADLAGLPTCVQKWLEQSQVLGKEKVSTVRLKQKALMKLEPVKSWMKVEAEQYFRLDKPGFVWKARVKMAPLVYFIGRDKYYEGKGQMLIKVLSLFNVVNSSGREIDQGSMLRFLAESVWFPTAALSDYIKWEDIDEHSARANMSYGGTTASGVFTFNDQGEPVKFSAKRYREAAGKYELTGWVGNMKQFGEFNGVRTPNKGEVIWKLTSGDFDWFHWEITEVVYNIPLPY
jgi:hypothetical protein